jgi:hypothetical protein
MHQHRSTQSQHTASTPLRHSALTHSAVEAPCEPERGRQVGRRRRLLFVTLMLVAITADVGCMVPIYSSSRDERARQLIFVSESLRHIPKIWERIWGLDMPDTATPYRVHGGVI